MEHEKADYLKRLRCIAELYGLDIEDLGLPGPTPMLSYENGSKAMQWLSKAFGFTERVQILGADGKLSHGEMTVGEGGGLVMLATPSPDYQSPRHHREICTAAAKWSQVPYVIDGVLVYVRDVKAHMEQARKNGATILSGIETGPEGRLLYRAEDIEGHRWMFMQK